jgi:hypothetical protein
MNTSRLRMMRCTVRARRCGIALEDQRARQPVRRDPRIPVVDVPRAVNPIHQKSSRSSAGVRMRRSTSTRMRSRSSGDTLSRPFAHQVVGPREQRGRLGREQLDDRFRDVGQTTAALLRAEVRRRAPERLLEIAQMPLAISSTKRPLFSSSSAVTSVASRVRRRVFMLSYCARSPSRT